MSFQAMIDEDREKKAHATLAQALLGSRSRTPAGAPRQQGLGASIASRSGVQRRPPPAQRTNSAPPPRAARAPPAATFNNNGPRRSRETLTDQRSNHRDDNPEDLYPQQQQQSFGRQDNNNYARSNGRPAVADSFNVRGAAKGETNVVVGENFEFETSAADIKAIMQSVGGDVNFCRLVATKPLVVAEMGFVSRAGGQAVIDTFDNKKADGHTLRVYWKYPPPSPAAVGFVVDTEPTAADAMEVDEHTRDREEQNRRREERSGAAPRGPASDSRRDTRDSGRSGQYPSGPSADRRGQYDNRSIYDDRRYQNGGGNGGYNGGGRGGGRGYPQRGQGNRY